MRPQISVPVVFTSQERELLRSELLDRAARDGRISGAAITGSAAAEREDQWSDIDLAFGVREAAELPEVLADWTAHMYDRRLALHHLDVKFGAWIYRVFLLPSTLQVDLAFVPATEFRALGPTFRLITGKANELRHTPQPQAMDLIGLGWLYALHARSSIRRGSFWQAEYMISGMRDYALALACLRYGVPAVQGRGLDRLPREVAGRFEGALVRQLDGGELSRAFEVVTHELLNEIRSVDAELAERLQDTLLRLTK